VLGQEWLIGSEDLRGQVEIGEVAGDGVEGLCLEALEQSQGLSGNGEKPESGPVEGLSENAGGHFKIILVLCTYIYIYILNCSKSLK